MRTFLRRILVASQWGASLALVSACGPQVESGGGSDSSGGASSQSGGSSASSGGASSSSGGGGEAGPPDASAPLDPYPDPTCVGPFHDGGYEGQCCYEVHCTAPVDGACPAASAAAPHLDGLPPGSGTCMCDGDGEGGAESIQGPYANRAASDPASCCYLVGAIGCEGRPLLVRGEPRVAPLARAPSAWSQTDVRRFERALADADLCELAPAERRELARRWAERGQNEHASVASFGRFALGLMALGAPPQLLEAAHRAAVDEVRHARLALAIASAYAGEPVGVGPLPLCGALDDLGSLEALTLATIVEGCIGETLSAIEAEVAAQAAQPPAVRTALLSIARDEARHAELAWAFVCWATAAGGAGLRARVAAAFARALDQVASAAPGSAGGELPPSHGFLPADELHRLRQQAITDVLRPAAAALVSARSPSADRELSDASGNVILSAATAYLST
ncbi:MULTISPECIES: hypothetical protein [Sorangium]|uniref:Secreted protein n=1 Tax=Sorangium cellulosum TaxID=56 RepID=A0A4P2R414_SORCE|nr:MULTISPECIES: hypothetical protein [Sorangium]AUX36733.1 uncharacterized protein SOCE836_089480 [Sorangium cellulosum]WCQ96031.1 hypothetical protein NQZ70_08814 [Sorangium sp. Soce836]